MSRLFILLTSALTPDPAYRVAVSSVEVRRTQYAAALDFWVLAAGRSGAALALVDTSGASGADFGRPADLVRYLSYDPLPDELEAGKGAVEAAAIDQALSDLELNDDSVVVKCTGRLQLANADRILSRLGGETDLITRRTLDRAYVDTRFFAVKAGAWRRELTGMAAEVQESAGHNLENVIAKRASNAEFDGNLTVGPFPVRPLVIGVSGTAGDAYRSGPLDRLRSAALGHLERKLVRGLSNKQV